MDLPDFLTRTEHGGIRMAGSRIGLEHVVEEFVRGASAEMIAARYPTLGLAHVYKAIAFYLENRTEVDAYVAETVAEYERQAALAHRPNWEEMRVRLEQIKRAQSRPAGV